MTLLQKLRRKLDTKELSAFELTQHYLANIKKLNPKLNAIISICEDHALLKAKAADKRIHENSQAFLTGIPVIYKDNFCTKDILTTCGSKMLSRFIPPYSASVVESLDNSGMITLAKANMDEFGMGSTNKNSYYGIVKNPYDLEYVPGGSSGGSAASVAANLAPISIGSDTGGSVRQPASFCGLTGIKPSYGSISRFGLVAYGSSFDQAGVISQSVFDAAYVLDAMSTIDHRDSTKIVTKEKMFSSMLLENRTFRIGFDPKLLEGFSKKTQKAILNTVSILENQGHSIQEISIPDLKIATSIYYILAPAEAAANLSRFDGVRFGFRSDSSDNLDELYVNTRTEGFGQEVKRRIMIGNYVLSSSQYKSHYCKAQKIRKFFHQSFQKLYQQVDMILMPTSATPASPINEQKDPITTYLDDMFTLVSNLTGNPAISFPIGQIKGMPFGGQLIANHLEDYKIINTVHHFQQETAYHLNSPPCQGDII
jgi:aspartyl-tRNA(Asn)/glutamyl-tRNA(Gln) amidotransferase subunit A